MIWKLTSFVKNARIALSSGQSDPATIRNSRASSLTLTLIFLSITFLFLTMPYSIFLILYDTLDNKIEDEYDLSIFSFLCAFFHLLWCCNSSVNFYLYCLTGSRFRAEFKNILHSFLRKYQSWATAAFSRTIIIGRKCNHSGYSTIRWTTLVASISELSRKTTIVTV